MLAQNAPEPEGILLVDKPAGLTSHDVVGRLRRTFHMKRIGHAGTLDPMATGLLIMLVGKATRVSQYLMGLDKEYEGEMTLGVVTNSQDADGEVVETHPVPELAPEAVRSLFAGFLGDQYQVPPMFSAIKRDGVPLYKLARRGEEVEREPRFIRISSFEYLGMEPPRIRFRLRCSKGTYVRTIAHDAGRRIGCGAHLSALRRTAVGSLGVGQARSLDEIEQLGMPGIAKLLIPPHSAVPSNLA